MLTKRPKQKEIDGKAATNAGPFSACCGFVLLVSLERSYHLSYISNFCHSSSKGGRWLWHLVPWTKQTFAEQGPAPRVCSPKDLLELLYKAFRNVSCYLQK